MPGVTDSTVMQIYLASTRVWHSLTTCYHYLRYTKENSSSGKSQKRLSLPLAGRIALKRTTSAAGDEASEEARYTIR